MKVINIFGRLKITTMKETILWMHGAFGVIIFALGVLQAILPKRGFSHTLMGKLYVFFWFPLIITGGYLGSWIIFALGGLGLYSALTGWRYAQSKKQLSLPLDKFIVLIGLSMAISLAAGSVYLFIIKAFDFAIIMSVFSVIFGLFVQVDVREVVFGKSVRLRSTHKMYWLFEHYGRMYISLIAAFSAFSAIQQPLSNQIVNWLWPTLAGTIILVILGKRYDKKYNIATRR